MNKKFLALPLVLLSFVTLASCGSNSESEALESLRLENNDLEEQNIKYEQEVIDLENKVDQLSEQVLKLTWENRLMTDKYYDLERAYSAGLIKDKDLYLISYQLNGKILVCKDPTSDDWKKDNLDDEENYQYIEMKDISTIEDDQTKLDELYALDPSIEPYLIQAFYNQYKNTYNIASDEIENIDVKKFYGAYRGNYVVTINYSDSIEEGNARVVKIGSVILRIPANGILVYA